jgi:peptidoglycan glycosyltransferase
VNRAILRLAGMVIALFVALAAALPYWGILRASELTLRPDNPRLVEAERRLARGRILDRDGEILAFTELGENGIASRRYPYPRLAPVIGYWSLQHGTAAIEAAFDDPLRGEPIDPSESLEQWLYHRPRVGDDVLLTIDLDVQRIADDVLGDAQGAIVVIEARTGAILALASHPTFDPASIDEAFPELRDDPNRPLLNRATQGRYPPGSTFKTVTLSAALQEGVVTTSQVFDDGDATLYVEGFPIRCNNNPAGIVSFDLAHAYAYSCNLTFARIGLDLGTRAFKDYAGRFRVDRDIPLEIPVTPGQLANDPTLMGQVLLASTAFGQGELLVTPLNMALIAATVASAGVMPQPYLASEVRGPTGEFIRSVQPRSTALSVPITQATARQVRDIMIVSVQDGYARRAQIPGATVGGKTGTAQLGETTAEPHAWFIGWAQATDNSSGGATYAVAVVVENGGAGSLVATPMGREVLAAALATAD